MAQLPSELFHAFLEELSLKKLENSMQVLEENGIDADAMVLVTIEDLKLMFPKLGDFLKIKSVFLAIYSKDIDSMLKDHPKGASILSEYERTGQLVLMKDLFVRIIVGNLVKDSNCYPNTEKKKALALEVINRFPTLRSGNGDGYDAYFRQYVEVLRNGKVKKYSPSGYIEERLKTLRKQLPITDKPHKPHQKRLRTDAVDLVNGPITEYFTEDERVLTHELLNETPNENRIKIIMASTYESRSLWVREGRPPIKTFFSSFPPLRNIYSSAFEEEFCRSAPNSKRLVDGLGDCFSRILLYAKGKRKGLSTDLTILLDEIAANNNLLEAIFL
ncbi:uncharacterized protein LOC100210731 isoform X4 [Hydra vulgaris]|uniref:uncharacterized protein LOC100210731 isoform X4 n=1 Tax=Hydra vulgaris TaxID=6087 RepID=UPI001F5F9865|nr:uncharacterized protein LOC100210731 isoform X5 [Hydra vulgaris]